MSEQWEPSLGELTTIRGMIIDRDEAWRAAPEWAPVIDEAVRQGIETLDPETFWKIHNFLWHSGLPGSYETYGYGDERMAKAWRRYIKRHYPKPADTVTT